MIVIVILMLVVALFLLYRMYEILSVIEEDYHFLKQRVFDLEIGFEDIKGGP